jgi:NTP pyrophosphatase (non-canonical NTP hydrolase)
MEKILPKQETFLTMNFNEYQEKARQFRKESANEMYAIIGLGAEVGEVQDKIAKVIRDGYPEDGEAFRVGLAKEIGDVLWFLSAIADDNGLSLDGIAQANIAKLESRLIRGVISGSGDNR